jgi:hypothetical protein
VRSLTRFLPAAETIEAVREAQMPRQAVVFEQVVRIGSRNEYSSEHAFAAVGGEEKSVYHCEEEEVCEFTSFLFHFGLIFLCLRLGGARILLTL